MATGIVLAGGESRRYGSPKAFAELDGRPFWRRAAEALAEAGCSPVVISVRPEHLGRMDGGFCTVTDEAEFAGDGPLAGIYSAMEAFPDERYVILPCDMPFIGPEEAARLMELALRGTPVTAVRTQDHPVPLVGVWSGTLKESLRQSLEAGERGVIRFLGSVSTDWIDAAELNENPAVFRNVNTPIDG
ncbi:molybdenum cofactor guanylyltransferase [Bhargavaea ullalensis]|uniref:Molybdopterin-guanine dinucleotide biosynthesis protein A n=1 Tax=Bhargavaea ullalensis TaxID=1265685 RepID=A0ABV2G7A3_9BACL